MSAASNCDATPASQRNSLLRHLLAKKSMWYNLQLIESYILDKRISNPCTTHHLHPWLHPITPMSRNTLPHQFHSSTNMVLTHSPWFRFPAPSLTDPWVTNWSTAKLQATMPWALPARCLDLPTLFHRGFRGLSLSFLHKPVKESNFISLRSWFYPLWWLTYVFRLGGLAVKWSCDCGWEKSCDEDEDESEGFCQHFLSLPISWFVCRERVVIDVKVERYV